MTIAEQLTTIINNTSLVNEKLKNAKSEALGAGVVRIDNVCSVSHKVDIGLSSKNLFDISKAEIIRGSISENTIIGNSGGFCFDYPLPNGKYTITFQKNTAGGDLIIRNGKVESGYVALSSNTTISFTLNNTYGYARFESYADSLQLSNIQIEAGSAATSYTPYISDTSGVEVLSYGKNFVNIYENIGIDNRGTYDAETKTVTTQYASGNSLTFESNYFAVPTGVSLTYSHSYTGRDRVVIRCFDAEYNNISSNYSGLGGGSYYLATYDGFVGGSGTGFTFTLPEEVAYISLCYCSMNTSDKSDNTYSNIQIEVGSTVTDYEDFIEPEATNTSLSPTMTLISDKGVNITARYFTEENKSLLEKYKEINDKLKEAKVLCNQGG